MKLALPSILLGIYDNEGLGGHDPMQAYRRVNAFPSKMPVCSMINGFARRGRSNEIGEGSATP